VYAKNFNWFVSTNEGEVPFNGSIKLDWLELVTMKLSL
jgi:hypothetical protein